MSIPAGTRTSLPPVVLCWPSNPSTWRWWFLSSYLPTWRWRSPRSFLSIWRWRSPRSQGGGTRGVPFLPNFPFQILILSTLPTLPVQYLPILLVPPSTASQYFPVLSVPPSTASQYLSGRLHRQLQGRVTRFLGLKQVAHLRVLPSS